MTPRELACAIEAVTGRSAPLDRAVACQPDEEISR